MSKRHIIKARVVLSIEIDMDQWALENEPESVQHVRAFMRSNVPEMVRYDLSRSTAAVINVTLENATGEEWT